MEGSHAGSHFQTTRWSLVQRAQSPDRGASAESREALASLCETYWYPLYAWLRRRGSGADEAHDAVQGFVARLLERHDLDSHPERGRFRSYLLGAFRHFVANEHRAASADKRGGGARPLSIDAESAAARWNLEPAARDAAGDPDAWFDRRWALDVLERALGTLEREQAERGRAERFEALRHTLAGAGVDVDYATIAEGLGISVSAVKVTVFRLRARLGELIRDAVADTVGAVDEVDAEVRALFVALHRT